MKPLKQKQTNNHQKEGNRIEDKKKTNIKFNSAIFFQLGLIVALVASAWVMNLNIGEATFRVKAGERISTDEPVFNLFDIEQPKVEPVKTIAKNTPPVQKRVTQVFEVVPDIAPMKETPLVAVISSPDIPVTPVIKTPVVQPPVKTSGTKNLLTVEFVPIFPGCETAGDNNARIACMNEKISRFVSRKFDTSVADDDTIGNQRISVQFKIDKNGNVLDIKALSRDKNLEKEAQRVISKLPEFTPGKMGNTAVDVMYMLPITFRIN